MDSPDDTIVALSTPIGEGGIAIVRLSGGGALETADRIFAAKDGSKPSGYRSHSVHYGHVVNRGREGTVGGNKGKEGSVGVNKGDGIIDEVLLTVMRAPRTYTKEDVVEINCHGGIQAVKNVLDLIGRHGARMAQPGEFTKRAFLNGRIDLVQAEAVLEQPLSFAGRPAGIFFFGGRYLHH